MELTERQNAILECAVVEHIRTAEPVSSQLLEERYRFDISPATLRNEMKTLSDEGFLYQPHTSAGRIPTEKGYRFFVDRVHARAKHSPRRGKELPSFSKERRELHEIQSVWRLAKELAALSSNLVVASLPSRRMIITEGWGEVVQEPEFENQEYLIEFANFLLHVERGLETLRPTETIAVYIGRENPWAVSKDFSVVVASCMFGTEKTGSIAMVGPMRMQYQKNIELLNELLETLS